MKEYIGKRVLYSEHGSSYVTEDQILELSPSGKYVRFRNTDWTESGHITVREVLPDE